MAGEKRSRKGGLTMTMALLLLSSCGFRDLVPFLEENAELPRNDKMMVEGTVCTTEPGQMILPRKIIFIMDQSGSLNNGTDASYSHPVFGYRTSDRQEAARSLVQNFMTDPAFFFNFIYFNDNAWRCPATDPYFGQGDMDACLRQLVDGENVTDIYGAFVNAFDLIRNDILDMEPILVPRTKYVIIFFADGVPNTDGDIPRIIDQPEEEIPNIMTRVGEIMSLTEPENGGVGSITIHSVLLSAGFGVGDPEYPYAIDLMTQIASHGQGQFIDTPDSSQLNFLQFVQTSISPMPMFKSFLVSNHYVRNLPSGTVLDSDGDGFSDEEEDHVGLNPRDPDSDGDGCGDYSEEQANFDPMVHDCPCPTGNLDSDGDFLIDCDEILWQTDPELVDTDQDGIPDSEEVWAGTNPTRADATDDPDGDGLNNIREVLQHTSPIHADGQDWDTYAYEYELVNRRFTTNQRECFDFRVNNISLGITLPSADLTREQGMNTLNMLISTVPPDVPDDLGSWRRDSFDARYMGPELKEPGDGFTVTDSQLERL